MYFNEKYFVGWRQINIERLFAPIYSHFNSLTISSPTPPPPQLQHHQVLFACFEIERETRNREHLAAWLYTAKD